MESDKPKLSDEDRRKRYLKRMSQLSLYRSTWRQTWLDISAYISPRRSRFFVSDVAAGGVRKEQAIIHAAPRLASRTLAAGMMAGITSPARPWFKLTVADADLAEIGPVKEWLSEVQKRMLDAMQRSNFYGVLHTLYGDLGDYCTAAMIIEEDDEETAHCVSLPIGEYLLAQNDKRQVDTLFREPALTVKQVVDKFGLEKASQRVKDLWKAGTLDVYINLIQAISPRLERNPGMPGPRNMAWESVWFEVGGGPGPLDSSAALAGESQVGVMGLLRDSGYEEQPFIAARWNTTGDDTYGTGPGWDALGDAKALSLMERKALQGIERLVDPPLMGPRLLGNRPVSLLPGALNYTEGNVTAGMKMEAVVAVPPEAIEVISAKIDKTASQIGQTYFQDLFMALLQDDRAQPMTAEEVRERSSEKLLQLGPVVERLQNEVLNPAIKRWFRIMSRRGQLPIPPKELHKQPFSVEYISILSQAVKAVASGGLQQFASFATNLAESTQKPEVLDVIDFDKMVAAYADAVNVDPSIMVGADKVAQIRQARARQQQAAAQQQVALAQATAAKTLSQADLGTDNALSRVAGPLAAAQAGGGIQ